MSNLHVDRESFILWTEGILLENKFGKIKLAEELECIEAEEELKKGNKVILMNSGRPVSTIQYDKDNNEYIEKIIYDND